MLYLIKSFTRNKPILKIGYTDNMENRMSQYFYANPGLELISTRKGDELLEDMIQDYLKFLGYQYQKHGKLNEWFIDDLKVYQVFHIHQEKLENKLWKHRANIFNLGKSVDLLVYEYLRDKNLDSYSGIEYRIIGRNKLEVCKSNKLDVEYQKILDEKESTAKYLNYKENKDSLNSEFLDAFYRTNNFTEKLKLLCEYLKTNDYDRKKLESVISQKYFDYYDFFGPERCRANSYKECELLAIITSEVGSDKTAEEVLKVFSPKNKYSKKFIKAKLSEIYVNLKITSTAKAVDLGKWFEVRACNYMENGKKTHGFEILALKGKA